MHARLNQALQDQEHIAVTEIVVAEALAGAKSARERQEVREVLLDFPLLRLEGLADYEEAAALYRTCRIGGETLRSIADCLIAVPAIRAGQAILHVDTDFDKLARHTALKVVEL